jgi:hypothetical protein
LPAWDAGLAGSRLLGSSLAFAIMTATGDTIITASDVMIAAVTGEDPHDVEGAPLTRASPVAGR